jgi:hypothetical protein
MSKSPAWTAMTQISSLNPTWAAEPSFGEEVSFGIFPFTPRGGSACSPGSSSWGRKDRSEVCFSLKGWRKCHKLTPFDQQLSPND